MSPDINIFEGLKIIPDFSLHEEWTLEKRSSVSSFKNRYADLKNHLKNLNLKFHDNKLQKKFENQQHTYRKYLFYLIHLKQFI